MDLPSVPAAWEAGPLRAADEWLRLAQALLFGVSLMFPSLTNARHTP